MHDFTNSVIRERKAEYRWVSIHFNEYIGEQEYHNNRERKKSANNCDHHNMEEEFFGKKKLAFLGKCINHKRHFLFLLY